MSRLYILIFVLLMGVLISYSQDLKNYDAQKEFILSELNKKGEVYFRFITNSVDIINKLSREISIDNVKSLVIGFEVFAYANEEEFKEFLKYNIPFEILKHPSDLFEVRMSDDINEIRGWDTYPTYDAYVNMMYQFQTTYPNLCKIIDAGNTVQNRKILFAVISDSVNFKKPKPQFMYSSSIHGDETTGYVLMLRLIDTLLSGYGVNPQITNLVKNVEIWINPLANPDGTYYGGNHTVNGAIRYNANNKDLNRNYPGPIYINPPVTPIQPETYIMMNIAAANKFRMSANFHGGAQVVNYPWDCKYALHPDDNWWIYVSRQYADTAHKYSNYNGYMTDLNNGITNGAAWYIIHGGRQDYYNYYQRCRECTIEISATKLLPPAQLPTYWTYNFKSFLNYIQKCLYGLRGIVTDSATGLPIKALVTTVGHDFDNTEIYSDSITGHYVRMIYTGTYSFQFSAPNYITKIFPNVYIKNDSTTILNVMLSPTSTSISKEENFPDKFILYQNYPNPFNPYTTIKYQLANNSFVKLELFDVSGKLISKIIDQYQTKGIYEINLNANDYKLSSGIYFYRLTTNNLSDTRRMILAR
ncbi:MAG: M14 family zinc carboxypeptidase [Ignavibacteria bacterium]|nr:M14 family zinc carboxypeptidase [Ignavibacteria bacterium]